MFKTIKTVAFLEHMQNFYFHKVTWLMVHVHNTHIGLKFAVSVKNIIKLNMFFN